MSVLRAIAFLLAVCVAACARTPDAQAIRESIENAAAAAQSHDAAALTDVLADGLRIGLTLFDPEVIVIGGGLAEAGDALIRPLDEALAGKLTFQYRPVVVRAELGDEAGQLGAGLLALSALEDQS